jgi:formate/nitrite transporter FocA (FNT family)
MQDDQALNQEKERREIDEARRGEEAAATAHLSPEDRKQAHKESELRPLVIYEIIRRRGVQELERPRASLFWSGVAGGVAVSTSVYGKAFLHGYMPDVEWKPIVTNIGYTVGFLIVILGRLQLFTENTITAVFPVLAHPTKRNIWRTARLWGLVFFANLIGCAIAALLGVVANTAPPDKLWAALDISLHFAENTALENILFGVPAGFFIAAIVWMLPNAKGQEFWVIFLLTYMIGLGGQTHVVAGATELFLLMFAGMLDPATAVFRGILPTLLGNVIGGTVLFALIAYGQIKEEMEENEAAG